MKQSHHRSAQTPCTVTVWRGCVALLELVREPWGHFTIHETGPEGRRIIVEADTRFGADAAFRREIARHG